METGPNPSVSSCPDRDALSAFCQGRLPDDSLEAIAEHLSVCPRCTTLLGELQSKDTLFSHMRRRPTDKIPVDEAVCQSLADKARAVGAIESIVSTVSEAGQTQAEPGPPLPAVFGPYLLLERLGQGGWGIVYKAQQGTLKRLVAVKMIRAGAYATSEERLRFAREGEAIARIRHGHVVQIHEFGEHEGQPYFSMELLEGGTLSQRLRAGPLPQREAAALTRTLAQAVAAAHEQGIVHRDLKPGNVLFTEDGSAKITDFGLAKILDGDDSTTVSEAILGTPVYMAPEQAQGEGRLIGPRTDVYALGAILYEMLTGRPPFRGGSRSQTLELVRGGEVEPPSRRCWGLSRDLEAICLKCLDKEPERRYPSASALAEDLEHWLHGEPTTARPASWSLRLWRQVSRHPRWASAAALLLIVAAAAAFASWLRDSDRPLRAIEAELARGRAQTLIGETGPPVWFNWCLGRETSTASTSVNEPFSIHTSNLALLELLRDPQRDRFRLVAELKHERNMDEMGAIGIFVAHQRYESQLGPVHYYLPLTFNDRKDESQRPPGYGADLPWQKMNGVLLKPRLFWEEMRWSEAEYRLSGPGPELFQSAGALGQKSSWRSLTLLVTPEGVHGFWGGEETLVGTLSAMELGPEVNKSLEERRQKQPEEPRYQGFAPVFFPRGSLGLYVKNGSASFRRVAIEPLNVSD